jgi:hypothetical protein
MNNYKVYEKQISEFGREIADETIKKEKDSTYKISLDRFSIASSISSIHNVELRTVTEDLDNSILKEIRIIKNFW